MACHIIKLLLASRIENLWLEGNSLNIINHLNGHVFPSCTTLNVVEKIRDELGKFNKVHLSHSYREANSATDWFTNEAVVKNMVTK